PRPLSRQRRANHLYTLICEEPICVWMKRSWLHLLTVYVEIVLNSGKAVSEFRERRPDFSANRTCDAIAAVMGRVGV
ncbi:hypothetical protein, partial [Mycobacteroides abscessus]